MQWNSTGAGSWPTAKVPKQLPQVSRKQAWRGLRASSREGKEGREAADLPPLGLACGPGRGTVTGSQRAIQMNQDRRRLGRAEVSDPIVHFLIILATRGGG